MGSGLSRRSFLKNSAIALGAVGACGIPGIGNAARAGGLQNPSSQALKEETMPHVIVKLWPGRSERQKARLAEAIVKDVVEILGGGEESVSVAIEEIEPAKWREKVTDDQYNGK